MTRRLIDTLWGSTGAVSDPGDTKLNLGWIAEIPPYQVQNYWQKRVDEALQHIEQLGIQDWHTDTEYQDLGLCLGSNGVTYQSQQAANQGHQPVADGGTWWEQANFTASLVAAGGYIKFHGDTPFIFQWGVDNVAGATVDDLVTLPLTYPNAHAVAMAQTRILLSTDILNSSAFAYSLTQVALSNNHAAAADVYWISVGW